MPPSTPPIAPGAWLGLLGGGQLGRMFCMAAQSLGYKVCVLDPGRESPAGAVADDHLCADYLDESALAELARRCRAATTEFENVPAAALAFLAQHCAVSPDAASVAIAQDRIDEKRFLAASGIQVAPHAVIAQADDLDRLDSRLLPGILKSARLGYDGKGQARVATVAEARAAWHAMGGVPCVLEQKLALQLELSVVVARTRDGAVTTFPVAENEHRGGILAVSIVPARIDEATAQRARSAAIAIATAMNYVGVLCVEFFVLSDGRLLANEIAPRPHNSGHYTIDACVGSQFDQQARVLAGQPLGDSSLLAPAVMLNVLGDVWYEGGRMREPDWPAVLTVPGAKLHLYGKSEARRGRKMGHVTCVAATLPNALVRATEVAHVLGITPP
ncbi:MAG TPA: 5-(carboxyamino)imidazole ribonucleotide synthase, partial [Burkholderiaceae bacterium]|nr:5-(carboxyamino)imidazole ribonucleotide synthase [Burkholderiaceae bacterium]